MQYMQNAPGHVDESCFDDSAFAADFPQGSWMWRTTGPEYKESLLQFTEDGKKSRGRRWSSARGGLIVIRSAW